MMKMKNLNGTSREGTGVNYKEGVKLLDIESSDSDSQEHFSLPPLELKGARKKKTKMKSAGPSSGSGGGGSCGSCCCRTLGVFLLVTALLSTAIIGYFTYRLQAEVRELKDKLAKVESWSQDNPNEFHNLHSNVQDINKDINEIKSKTANQLLNITDIYKQIGQLNTSTISLKNSLAKAPELETLPGEVRQVQQQLIKIGSDLETLKTNTKEMDGFQSYKDSITEQLTHIKTRLATLETKPTDDAAEPSASSRDVVSLRNTLQGSIEKLNFTLTTKFNKMSQDRDLQMAQFISLRNRTMSLVNHMDELDTRVTNAMDPAQTRNIISEEISKLNVTSGRPTIDSTALQDLRLRVINITQEVASLRPQQMATSENVANLTRRVDTLSTQMENDMQVMTESMGDTKVTDLKTRLDEHEVRLGKLELQTPGGAQPSSLPTLPPPAEETVKPAEEAPLKKATQPQDSSPAREESTDGWSPTPVPLPTKTPDNVGTQAPADQGTQPSGGAMPPQPPQDEGNPGQHDQQQRGAGTDEGSERAARDSRRTSGEDDTMDSLISALEKESHQ